MSLKIHHVDVRPGDKWWIPGDIHFDQEDTEALNVSTSMIDGEKVNGIALIGDTLNSQGISRHASLKALRNFRFGKGTIKAEREAANPFFTEWRAMVERNRMGRMGGLHCLEGNHEKWWGCVQDEFPGLLDTHWTELYGDLFNGWHVHGENSGLKFSSLLVVHGHRVRGSLARKSAHKVWSEYPNQNTLYGHTHRQEYWIGATMKNGVQEFHGAWTIGHFRNRDSELDDSYMGAYAERHIQGGALVDFFDRGDDSVGFNVQLIPVLRDALDRPMMVVNGRVYK